MDNRNLKSHDNKHGDARKNRPYRLPVKNASNFPWKSLILRMLTWITLALIVVILFNQLRAFQSVDLDSSITSRISSLEAQICSALPVHGSAYMIDPSIMQRTDVGYAGLEIRNDHDHPMVGLLLDITTNEQLLALSIHSGHTMQLSVPIGNYGMKILIGSKWCNLDNGFTDGAIVSVADGIPVHAGSTTSLHFSGSGLHPIQLALAYSQSISAHAQTIDHPAEVIGVGELELKQTRDGHYLTSGYVNGTPVVFMIDTGATAVSISSATALLAGIRDCTPLQATTANGQVNACIAKAAEITFGSFKLANVDVAIMPDMPGESLLGMNVLRNFHIEQVNRIMRISTP